VYEDPTEFSDRGRLVKTFPEHRLRELLELLTEYAGDEAVLWGEESRLSLSHH
jgi:hypothetical protein